MGPLHVDKTFNITVSTTNTKLGNSNQYDYILFFIRILMRTNLSHNLLLITCPNTFFKSY